MPLIPCPPLNSLSGFGPAFGMQSLYLLEFGFISTRLHAQALWALNSFRHLAATSARRGAVSLSHDPVLHLCILVWSDTEA